MNIMKAIKKIPYNKEVSMMQAFPCENILCYDELKLEIINYYSDWIKITNKNPIRLKRIKKTFWERFF